MSNLSRAHRVAKETRKSRSQMRSASRQSDRGEFRLKMPKHLCCLASDLPSNNVNIPDDADLVQHKHHVHCARENMPPMPDALHYKVNRAYCADTQYSIISADGAAPDTRESRPTWDRLEVGR